MPYKKGVKNINSNTRNTMNYGYCIYWELL